MTPGPPPARGDRLSAQLRDADLAAYERDHAPTLPTGKRCKFKEVQPT
ncbi:MAG: hypothetical protein VX309_05805 [Pseudomonadota bacterium]|nr:hypothetical protein [Pseudomonadota bacterium]